MIPLDDSRLPKSTTMLAPQKIVRFFDCEKKPSFDASTVTCIGRLFAPGWTFFSSKWPAASVYDQRVSVLTSAPSIGACVLALTTVPTMRAVGHLRTSWKSCVVDVFGASVTTLFCGQ